MGLSLLSYESRRPSLCTSFKFSDGSDLTAEDVAKSILAVPVNLGQYNGSYGRLSTIIEDAVATDEYTVELHLTQPYYNTLRELCLANPFGIVSILASVLSIVQILSDGNTLIWASTILTTGLLALATAFALRRR